MTCADFIVGHLESLGVMHVFGMAGGLGFHLFDSVARSRLTFVASNHEQCAGFAADAYARQTGKLGVAIITGGPAVSNILTPVIGCWQDSIPLLVIAGQVKRASLMRHGERQRGTFEINPLPIFKSVTKAALRLDEPDDALMMFQAALARMNAGRPGPVVIEIPLDVQGAEYDHH